MPVFTISAVDTGNEQLTVTAHGQVTGNGPAAVRAVGAGSALPSPLAPVTDYWLIVVDANTIKLATSQANALAGTAINLTSVGSGTLVLELGIPYRRARTYAPISQVKSADLNAIQDALVAAHGLITGQAQSILSEDVDINGKLHVDGRMSYETFRQAVTPLAFASAQGPGISHTNTKPGTVVANGTTAYFPLQQPHDSDARIERFYVTVAVTAGGNGTYTLVETDHAVDEFDNFSDFVIGPSASSGTLFDDGTPAPTVSGKPLWLKVENTGSANIKVFSCVLQYDRPAT